MGFFETDKVILAIVGSRTFDNYIEMSEYIDNICKKYNYIITEVVSGGARGADFLGAKWAREHNIPLTEFKANWDLYGKSAGFKRNIDIIKACDICIAFWDGKSRGTQHDIELCKKLNKPCYIYKFKNE